MRTWKFYTEKKILVLKRYVWDKKIIEIFLQNLYLNLLCREYSFHKVNLFGTPVTFF